MDTGAKTTEFWVTTIGGILIALIPVLVAYGVLTSELAEVWKGVILAIIAIVVPPTLGSIAKNYTTNRTVLKMEVMAMETARYEAMGQDA